MASSIVNKWIVLFDPETGTTTSGQNEPGTNGNEVEGDLKAPFSITTTPMCRGGHYYFPWIAPLYSWYVPYTAEC